MGIPSEGEVTPHEVNEWVQEQAQYLSCTRLLVLWYLAANAFRTESNPESEPIGRVMSGRTAMSKIQYRTGLGERTVRDALRDLQAAGYIIAEHKSGNGRSLVHVFWGDIYDNMRAEFRAGIRALPKNFRRTEPAKPKRGLEVAPDADILPFRTGK
jgi:DNA-binding transcriptional ArsR family regulator